MSTPSTQNLTKSNAGKEGTGGDQETYTGIRYGCNHGSLCFGHISQLADVVSDILLQATEGTHQISLDKNGPRKGFTSVVAPSNFQVGCGRDNKKEQETCFIHAENGNITIKASNGKIKLQANDIEFCAKGEDGSEGNFVVSATENITFKDCKKFQVDAKNIFRLASPGIAEIVADTQMQLYSGVVRGVTAGVALKDGKNGGAMFRAQKVKSFIA